MWYPGAGHHPWALSLLALGAGVRNKRLKSAFRNFAKNAPKLLPRVDLPKLITSVNVSAGSRGKLLCGWVKVPCAPGPELNRLHLLHMT